MLKRKNPNKYIFQINVGDMEKDQMEQLLNNFETKLIAKNFLDEKSFVIVPVNQTPIGFVSYMLID